MFKKTETEIKVLEVNPFAYSRAEFSYSACAYENCMIRSLVQQGISLQITLQLKYKNIKKDSDFIHITTETTIYIFNKIFKVYINIGHSGE